MATIARAPATEDDLLAAPHDGNKYELVDGAICMSPAGFRHGTVVLRLARLLGNFVEERGLGWLADSSTGYRMPSGNVRCPDLSFVATGRLPDGVPEGFCPVVPDLAVEIVSPRDRPRQVLDRVGEYLDSGVRMVWVIHPATRRATVHRSIYDAASLGPEDVLDGGDVFPGFSCRLDEIV